VQVLRSCGGQQQRKEQRAHCGVASASCHGMRQAASGMRAAKARTRRLRRLAWAGTGRGFV
jgi:hypothetical protein